MTFCEIATANAVSAPQIAVGGPSWMAKPDDASSAKAVMPMPAAASLPLPDSSGTSMSSAILPLFRVSRQATRSTAKVTAIEATDGRAKCGSHCSSGGMCEP